MSTVFVVMGGEFYSSWPVRVFRTPADATAFAEMLTSRYEELRQPTDADMAYASEHDVPVEIVADGRAQNELRASGLDQRAGGLKLHWVVTPVPEGPPPFTG